MERQITAANPDFEHECSGCFVRTMHVGKWVMVALGSMGSMERGLIIKLCPACAPIIAKTIDGQMKELIGKNTQ